MRKILKKICEILNMIVTYISDMDRVEIFIIALVFSLSIIILICLIELGRRMMNLGIWTK